MCFPVSPSGTVLSRCFLNRLPDGASHTRLPGAVLQVFSHQTTQYSTIDVSPLDHQVQFYRHFPTLPPGSFVGVSPLDHQVVLQVFSSLDHLVQFYRYFPHQTTQYSFMGVSPLYHLVFFCRYFPLDYLEQFYRHFLTRPPDSFMGIFLTRPPDTVLWAFPHYTTWYCFIPHYTTWYCFMCGFFPTIPPGIVGAVAIIRQSDSPYEKQYIQAIYIKEVKKTITTDFHHSYRAQD